LYSRDKTPEPDERPEPDNREETKDLREANEKRPQVPGRRATVLVDNRKAGNKPTFDRDR
jgi:hypothetical protein